MKEFKNGELYIIGSNKYLVFNMKSYDLYNWEYSVLANMSECERLNEFQTMYKGKDSRP